MARQSEERPDRPVRHPDYAVTRAAGAVHGLRAASVHRGPAAIHAATAAVHPIPGSDLVRPELRSSAGAPAFHASLPWSALADRTRRRSICGNRPSGRSSSSSRRSRRTTSASSRTSRTNNSNCSSSTHSRCSRKRRPSGQCPAALWRFQLSLTVMAMSDLPTI